MSLGPDHLAAWERERMSGHVSGRRVSSLSVTYQEEFHKPLSAPLGAVAMGNPSDCTRAPCVPQLPTKRPLDDTCEEFQSANNTHIPPQPSSLTSHVPLWTQPSCPAETVLMGCSQGEASLPRLPSSHSAVVPQAQQLPASQQQLPQGSAPPPYPSQMVATPGSFAGPGISAVYRLEDSLRHRINVEIENFRSAVQLTLSEQLSSYQHCVSSGINVGTEESPRGCNGVSGMMDYRAPHEDPGQGSFHNCGGCYQDDSLYSSETSATDSGVLCTSDAAEAGYTSGGVGDGGGECGDGDLQLERQMDRCVIQLQTLAALVTSTLCRAEYSVAH